MTQEYSMLLEGKQYTLVVSDDKAALLAAKAAGRAVLGRYDSRNLQDMPIEIPYMLEKGQVPSEKYLEKVIRRQAGLPWRIAESRRLVLREMVAEDWEALRGMKNQPEKEECPLIFRDRQAFSSYIRNQYSFYGYGIWAAEEKESRAPAGAAGLWDLDLSSGKGPKGAREGDLEIGYWIRPSFRRQGYGREAVKQILDYAREQLTGCIYAKIREGNLPSRNLAAQSGFTELPAQTGSKIIWYRCGLYSRQFPDSRG